MAKACVAAGLIRVKFFLAAAGTVALAACGGGGTATEDVQAMASTAVGGQALPPAIGIQTTSRALDVAIDGGGAFVLRDPHNGTQVLSRLGRFDIDALGRLINDEGWLVEGVAASQAPSTLAELAPLSPITAMLPPMATRKVLIEANLAAKAPSATDGGTAPSPFDFHDATTYNHSTSITVYDALGRSVALSLFFRKMARSVWYVYAAANGVAVLPDANGMSQPITQLSFSRDGVAPINPADVNRPLPPIIVDIPPTAELGSGESSGIAAVEVNLSTLSAFGAPFSPTYQYQDGAPPARLSSASVRATGELVLSYSDGRVDASRRLVLARTTVADRLHPYGVSGWLCGRGCQSPVVALPGQMLTGMLVSGALNAGN